MTEVVEEQPGDGDNDARCKVGSGGVVRRDTND